MLQSYDDYKPALYIYLVMPFIKLIGLNETAIRLPSALMGILAVFLTYFIIYELSLLSHLRKDKAQAISLVSSALVSISPWHIFFSHAAFEANVSLTFTLAGTYCFLKGLVNKKCLLLSGLFFSLTYYTYQGAKVYTTLFVTLLVLLFFNQVKKMTKVSILSITLFFLLAVIFLITTITTPDSLLRAKGVSV